MSSGVYRNTGWKISKVDGAYICIGSPRFATLAKLKGWIDKIMDGQKPPNRIGKVIVNEKGSN